MEYRIYFPNGSHVDLNAEKFRYKYAGSSAEATQIEFLSSDDDVTALFSLNAIIGMAECACLEENLK